MKRCLDSRLALCVAHPRVKLLLRQGQSSLYPVLLLQVLHGKLLTDNFHASLDSLGQSMPLVVVVDLIKHLLHELLVVLLGHSDLTDNVLVARSGHYPLILVSTLHNRVTEPIRLM